MPAVNMVYSLPQEVRMELMKRLINTGFSQYEAHSEWLNSLGYDVSKSTVHRFGQKLESGSDDFLSNEVDEITQSALTNRSLRMRCVEAAVSHGASDVLAESQSYWVWITQ